jgi:hypothetical protein
VRVGQGRITDLQRQSGTVEQRSTFLIATNGEKTECDYFQALKREGLIRAGRAVIAFERGSPEDVVRGAAKRRDRDDFDQAWAVCDVDQFTVEGASSLARESQIELIWSNPCFEVWLILHKGDCAGYLENGRRAETRLRGHLTHWNKTDLRFDDFRDGISDAVRRAKALGEAPHANPSTAVWRLIESLFRSTD